MKLKKRISMIHHHISDYLQAKQKYENTTFSVINGDRFYVINGELIPEKKYLLSVGGVPRYEHPLPDNADGKNYGSGIVPYKSSKK